MIEIVNAVALVLGYLWIVVSVIVVGTVAWWAVEHRIRAWRDRWGG